MSVWSDVLEKLARKYKIMSWGREIECGRPYGIVRLSTQYMRSKHLTALTLAIQQAPQLLREISIHFAAKDPKEDQLTNPFYPGGIHYKYLAWLDQPLPQICNPYPKKAR